MNIKQGVCAAIIVLSPFLLGSCSKSREPAEQTSGRLKVIASLFPVYEFARNAAGPHADVVLLLPPGAEPHSFEPRPADLAALQKADLFIFTNRVMEPWAEKMLTGAANPALKAVNAGKGISLLDTGDEHPDPDRGKRHHPEKHADPHIWLDLGNAARMVDTIAEAFMARDPVNAGSYRNNADAYKVQLAELDGRFRSGLSDCKKRTVIDGGHYTFGYLAGRYGLAYRAAYGIAPDAEPTAREMADISRMLREQGLKHLFFEELLAPRVAETIARETGATLLSLRGAHNVSRREMDAGTTYIELMDNNLKNLRVGLQCR